MNSPNILLMMTDEERYPPPYKTEPVMAFYRDQLTAPESIRDGAASRATLLAGQYPSLHGFPRLMGHPRRSTTPP